MRRFICFLVERERLVGFGNCKPVTLGNGISAVTAKGGVTPRQIAASDVRAELVRRGVRL